MSFLLKCTYVCKLVAVDTDDVAARKQTHGATRGLCFASVAKWMSSPAILEPPKTGRRKGHGK